MTALASDSLGTRDSWDSQQLSSPSTSVTGGLCRGQGEGVSTASQKGLGSGWGTGSGGHSGPRSACAQLCLPVSLMNINEQKGGRRGGLICLILRWLPR